MKGRSVVGLIVSLAVFGINFIPVQAQNQDRTQAISPEVSPDPLLERAILRENPDYPRVATAFSQDPRYFYNKVDLNGDNRPEVLVHITGPYFCGSGGCTTLIFQSLNQNYRLVSAISVSTAPVIVTNQKSSGWNDLIIVAAGGSWGSNQGYYLLRFNGRTYPNNPGNGIKLRPNSIMAGRAFFSNLDYNNGGIALRPQNSQIAAGQSSSSGQQTATGRSANSNSGQQTATGRVSTPRQSLPVTNSSQELVVSNVGCTSNLQNILGQSALDYCRSAEADSGILFDKFIQTKNRDGSITVEIRLFNRGSADGLIEIYDARGNLVDVKIINGNKPPTGFLQSGYRMFVEYPQTWWSRYPIGDSRRDLKEQSFSITIPAGGFVNITKSSNLALWYNEAMLALEVPQLKDPEFTQQESVKKFILGFAKDAVFSKQSKTVINIFKSEPSLQGVFTLDFLDERKVRIVLQRLWEYTLTITRDESDGSLKNPLYEAFQEVGLDTANVGVENAIDRFLLPGLGTFVRSVRQGGNGLNTLARILDYNNAIKSGEKGTVTIRNVSTTGRR